jgi:serine/threonine protein phosphatase PrpC
MGPFLSKPNTKASTQMGRIRNLEYCVCQMQGWRSVMEDFVIYEPEISKDVSLFGILDGHGGSEVARFVQKNFVEQLLKNQNFQRKIYQRALYENFLKMDDLLLTSHGIAQVNNQNLKMSNYNLTRKVNIEMSAGCTALFVLLNGK